MSDESSNIWHLAWHLRCRLAWHLIWVVGLGVGWMDGQLRRRWMNVVDIDMDMYDVVLRCVGLDWIVVHRVLTIPCREKVQGTSSLAY